MYPPNGDSWIFSTPCSIAEMRSEVRANKPTSTLPQSSSPSKETTIGIIVMMSLQVLPSTAKKAVSVWNQRIGRRWPQKRFSSSQSSKPAEAISKTGEQIAIPNSQQLRIVALRAAIPMVGFGFMDNLVMITAGDAIDTHFGATLAISTMAAAGFGQCCSDVAGITCGGLVDATVSKLQLPTHGLSQAQLDLRITRMYSTFGACGGVLVGCLLGMSILLFMDTERVDRARKAKELQSIFESVMTEGANLVNAERATLFMLDREKEELWSQVATGTDGIIKVSSSSGIVGAGVQSGEMINVKNAYEDDRFNPEVDTRTGFHTTSILTVPVKDENGEIVGAIQLCNKKFPNGKIGEFGINDEKLLKMLGSHVASFIRIVDGSSD